MKITDLKPEIVWKFFHQVTQVPRPSKKEGKMIEFLESFAKQYKIAIKKDAVGNILMSKPATPGKENLPTVVLQSHMDMVCEKNNGTAHDFDHDPIETIVDGNWLRANGTTLGADNGIGVAAELAILASDDIEHGPIECLFTVDEETGLTGAKALEKGFMTGDILLNLDSEDEGEIFMGCAGGKDTQAVFHYEPRDTNPNMQYFKIEVKGLNGGHSGGEIDKEHGNANKLLARVLFTLNRRYGVQLSWMQGGIKDNAIPREASAAFVCQADLETVAACVQEMKTIFARELEFSDAGVDLAVKEIALDAVLCIEDSEEVITLLMTLPNGLRHHSMSIEGLSTASSNIGVVTTDEEALTINASLRGAMESYVDTLAMEMDALAEVFGFHSEHEARYPAWSYRADSPMRECLKTVCHRVLGKELQLVAVHGGLECGVFKAMDEDMDIVTMGPKMQDIHTPQEALDLASFDATFTLLKAYLEEL